MDVETVELSEEVWRQKLTPEQFKVLRKHGTERAGTRRARPPNRGPGNCRAVVAATDLQLRGPGRR